ncbi:MAG: phosphoribosylglycinamide formyltransferase [Opitutae bacterium]|nr:phosphoribosylglycinamide formyltransferase [Opitutae bacterium]MCD8298604.1 phosphoribosylglycinamide formyltransferase [Opitutae bacterium]
MKFAILGSGTGTNAEAILRAWRDGRLGNACPVAVFCDIAGARILSLGEKYGVPARFLDPGKFRTKFSPEREVAYVEEIKNAGAEFVVLAGFMRVLKTPFLEAFPGKIINLHPSLLPAFPGLDGIGQAWRYGVAVSGCTVHYVDASVDGGAIIDQAVVRREKNDTQETFAQKIHDAEHVILPDVIRRISLGEA